MRSFVLTAAALSILALTGCTPDAGDPSAFAEILPDERIEVSLPVELDGRRTKNWSEAYLFTARITDNVNTLAGGILRTVDVITDHPATWSSEEDNTAVWGPFSDALDPVDTILVVQYDPATDEYTWAISQRPKELAGDDEAWVGVVAGHVDAGATPEDSSGWLAVDFTALNTLDPNQTATGSFAITYDIDPDGVTAEAGFEQFADGEAPRDAYYRYGQDFAGEGYMDLVWSEDIHPGDVGEETLAVRSRWMADGAGRADAVVFDGDLPAPGQVTDCWDTAFEVAYYDQSWTDDNDQGDASACVFAEPAWNEDDAPSEVR